MTAVIDDPDAATAAVDRTQARVTDVRTRIRNRTDDLAKTQMCTRMSYAELVETMGGTAEADEFYNRVCADSGRSNPID